MTRSYSSVLLCDNPFAGRKAPIFLLAQVLSIPANEMKFGDELVASLFYGRNVGKRLITKTRYVCPALPQRTNFDLLDRRWLLGR
ncbi:hypothetical protein [Mesorhizobium sp. CA7]|uniref:hypothetical protein n=1 Tax=Mesorhizobium sp. CA7 TaxID=588501 RepID=UPI001CCED92A|nr:hypothetical protein [Mesorhizobium sp. CA7]MBZ9815762.1 hypothetical protein [Mesorhizobium sp. CA7]